MDLRGLSLFSLGAVLASLQISGCGEEERPPLTGTVYEQDKKPIPYERLPEATDAFVEKECSTKLREHATQCGIVTVPESPGSDHMIELAVMRVFSNEAEPAEDPVVYLEGGPGGAIIQHLDDEIFKLFAPLAQDRDLVFVDQRGTGASKPSLMCIEGGEISQALQDCYARLSEDSDPHAYTTTANARDIDLVRQAFGYDQWNLLGISYGTRLALTILRDRPEGVRSAILDAVVPLEVDLIGGLAKNGQSSFEKVFAVCADDDECAEKYPNPMAQLREVAAKLNEDPKEFEGFSLSGEDFVAVLFNALYSPQALSFVPYIIDQAAQDEFELFQDLGEAFASPDFAFGMHLSVQCAEEVAFTDEATIDIAEAAVHPELLDGLTGREYLTYCANWPVPPAPALENMAVQSDVPTLIFAGHFDPVTPPAYSQVVHDQLANSEYFLLTNSSHGSSITDCGAKLSNAFLTNPGAPVESSCLDDLPDPQFLSQKAAGAGSHTVGGNVRMAIEAPTAEEIEAAKEDLRRRAHL